MLTTSVANNMYPSKTFILQKDCFCVSVLTDKTDIRESWIIQILLYEKRDTENTHRVLSTTFKYFIHNRINPAEKFCDLLYIYQ